MQHEAGVSPAVFSDQQIADKIAAALGAARGVMIGSTISPPVLVGRHAYSVSSIKRNAAGNITAIVFYNPHGSEVTLAVRQLSENIGAIYTQDP